MYAAYCGGLKVSTQWLTNKETLNLKLAPGDGAHVLLLKKSIEGVYPVEIKSEYPLIEILWDI